MCNCWRRQHSAASAFPELQPVSRASLALRLTLSHPPPAPSSIPTLVWSAVTRGLARLKVSGRRADVKIVLIPSTKVFLNSGSLSETMNSAGFDGDTPAPQRRVVPRLKSGNSAPTWLTDEPHVRSVLAGFRSRVR